MDDDPRPLRQGVVDGRITGGECAGILVELRGLEPLTF
jgi:hypothetical protein